MKSETIRNYIQYIGAGLVIFTTLILAFIIIPGHFVDKTPGLQLGCGNQNANCHYNPPSANLLCFQEDDYCQ